MGALYVRLGDLQPVTAIFYGVSPAVIALIASLTLWWVGRTHADLYVMFFSSAMIGATLGFLRYNFPPARIFMGDTGSQFLGLVLAAISLLENSKGAATVTLLFPLVALGAGSRPRSRPTAAPARSAAP